MKIRITQEMIRAALLVEVPLYGDVHGVSAPARSFFNHKWQLQVPRELVVAQMLGVAAKVGLGGRPSREPTQGMLEAALASPAAQILDKIFIHYQQLTGQQIQLNPNEDAPFVAIWKAMWDKAEGDNAVADAAEPPSMPPAPDLGPLRQLQALKLALKAYHLAPQDGDEVMLRLTEVMAAASALVMEIDVAPKACPKPGE